jgi:hypothetical protein
MTINNFCFGPSNSDLSAINAEQHLPNSSTILAEIIGTSQSIIPWTISLASLQARNRASCLINMSSTIEKDPPAPKSFSFTSNEYCSY